MDKKDFIPIGIVKVLWNFDIVKEIADAYFEFYIPDKVDYSYGNMYCNRFVFIKDNVSYYVDTMESLNFNFDILEYNEKNDIYKVNFIDTIIYLNTNQLDLLKIKIDENYKKNQK